MAMEAVIETRRTKESEMISVKGFVSLAELVQIFGVSESTVRRDLEVLEEQGAIRRTYGGAVFVKDTASTKLAFAERETTALAQKRAIARAIAGLIPVNHPTPEKFRGERVTEDGRRSHAVRECQSIKPCESVRAR